MFNSLTHTFNESGIFSTEGNFIFISESTMASGNPLINYYLYHLSKKKSICFVSLQYTWYHYQSICGKYGRHIKKSDIQFKVLDILNSLSMDLRGQADYNKSFNILENSPNNLLKSIYRFIRESSEEFSKYSFREDSTKEISTINLETILNIAEPPDNLLKNPMISSKNENREDCELNLNQVSPIKEIINEPAGTEAEFAIIIDSLMPLINLGCTPQEIKAFFKYIQELTRNHRGVLITLMDNDTQDDASHELLKYLIKESNHHIAVSELSTGYSSEVDGQIEIHSWPVKENEINRRSSTYHFKISETSFNLFPPGHVARTVEDF